MDVTDTRLPSHLAGPPEDLQDQLDACREYVGILTERLNAVTAERDALTQRLAALEREQTADHAELLRRGTRIARLEAAARDLVALWDDPHAGADDGVFDAERWEHERLVRETALRVALDASEGTMRWT